MNDRLSILQVSYPEVYKAYELKEHIRAIISMSSVTVAQESLNQWIAKAANSGLPHFEKLSEKIERHKENILNTIRLQANSSKSEAIRRFRTEGTVDNGWKKKIEEDRKNRK